MEDTQRERPTKRSTMKLPERNLVLCEINKEVIFCIKVVLKYHRGQIQLYLQLHACVVLNIPPKTQSIQHGGF